MSGVADVAAAAAPVAVPVAIAPWSIDAWSILGTFVVNTVVGLWGERWLWEETGGRGGETRRPLEKEKKGSLCPLKAAHSYHPCWWSGRLSICWKLGIEFAVGSGAVEQVTMAHPSWADGRLSKFEQAVALLCPIPALDLHATGGLQVCASPTLVFGSCAESLV